jgi:hypothetical protein
MRVDPRSLAGQIGMLRGLMLIQMRSRVEATSDLEADAGSRRRIRTSEFEMVKV